MKSHVDESYEILRAFALRMPGAFEDFPWGEAVIKVNKKIFVFLGHKESDQLDISVKLPNSCTEALQIPGSEPTPYGLGKSGWVTLHFGRGDRPPNALIQSWIEESYRAIAPKKLVKQLDEWEQ